jgi:hypothetical protein
MLNIPKTVSYHFYREAVDRALTLEEQAGKALRNIEEKLGDPAVMLALKGTRLEYRFNGKESRVVLIPKKKKRKQQKQ